MEAKPDGEKWRALDYIESPTFTDKSHTRVLLKAHSWNSRKRPLRACLHEGGGPQVGEVTCGGLPHLTCKREHIKMRDCMDRRVTPPTRVTSPTWGPPPSCKQALKMPRFGGRLRGMVAHEGCSTCSQSTDSLKWSIHPASSKTVMIQFLADFTANLDQAYDSINEFIIRKFNPLVVVHFRFIAVFLHAL